VSFNFGNNLHGIDGCDGLDSNIDPYGFFLVTFNQFLTSNMNNSVEIKRFGYWSYYITKHVFTCTLYEKTPLANQFTAKFVRDLLPLLATPNEFIYSSVLFVLWGFLSGTNKFSSLPKFDLINANGHVCNYMFLTLSIPLLYCLRICQFPAVRIKVLEMCESFVNIGEKEQEGYIDYKALRVIYNLVHGCGRETISIPGSEFQGYDEIDRQDELKYLGEKIVKFGSVYHSICFFGDISSSNLNRHATDNQKRVSDKNLKQSIDFNLPMLLKSSKVSEKLVSDHQSFKISDNVQETKEISIDQCKIPMIDKSFDFKSFNYSKIIETRRDSILNESNGKIHNILLLNKAELEKEISTPVRTKLNNQPSKELVANKIVDRYEMPCDIMGSSDGLLRLIDREIENNETNLLVSSDIFADLVELDECQSPKIVDETTIEHKFENYLGILEENDSMLKQSKKSIVVKQTIDESVKPLNDQLIDESVKPLNDQLIDESVKSLNDQLIDEPVKPLNDQQIDESLKPLNDQLANRSQILDHSSINEIKIPFIPTHSEMKMSNSEQSFLNDDSDLDDIYSAFLTVDKGEDILGDLVGSFPRSNTIISDSYQEKIKEPLIISGGSELVENAAPSLKSEYVYSSSFQSVKIASDEQTDKPEIKREVDNPSAVYNIPAKKDPVKEIILEKNSVYSEDDSAMKIHEISYPNSIEDVEIDLNAFLDKQRFTSPSNPNETRASGHESENVSVSISGKFILIDSSIDQNLDSIIIHQYPQVVLPFLRKSSAECIHSLLNHIKFSEVEQPVCYQQLYSTGLLTGRFKNTTLGTIEEINIVQLHFILKKVFELDSTLLIDLLQDWELPTPTSILNQSHSDLLENWIKGLESLHKHFIPLSKGIHKMEACLKDKVSLAQALVLVRDKISIIKLSTQGGRKEDKGSSLSLGFGKLGDVSGSRYLGSMLFLDENVLEWAKVLIN
jgi:hypothetical protein